jgi:hypothetical protein
MVDLHITGPKFEALELKMFVYFTPIWYFYDLLLYVPTAILSILWSSFGMLYREKSGNPDRWRYCVLILINKLWVHLQVCLESCFIFFTGKPCFFSANFHRRTSLTPFTDTPAFSLSFILQIFTVFLQPEKFTLWLFSNFPSQAIHRVENGLLV